MFVAWTMTATYLVIGLWPRLRFLGAFAAPILFAIGVFALLTPKDVGAPGRPEPDRLRLAILMIGEFCSALVRPLWSGCPPGRMACHRFG